MKYALYSSPILSISCDGQQRHCLGRLWVFTWPRNKRRGDAIFDLVYCTTHQLERLLFILLVDALVHARALAPETRARVVQM